MRPLHVLHPRAVCPGGLSNEARVVGGRIIHNGPTQVELLGAVGATDADRLQDLTTREDRMGPLRRYIQRRYGYPGFMGGGLRRRWTVRGKVSHD